MYVPISMSARKNKTRPKKKTRHVRAAQNAKRLRACLPPEKSARRVFSGGCDTRRRDEPLLHGRDTSLVFLPSRCNL